MIEQSKIEKELFYYITRKFSGELGIYWAIGPIEGLFFSFISSGLDSIIVTMAAYVYYTLSLANRYGWPGTYGTAGRERGTAAQRSVRA